MSETTFLTQKLLSLSLQVKIIPTEKAKHLIRPVFQYYGQTSLSLSERDILIEKKKTHKCGNKKIIEMNFGMSCN